jgi:hypothetical protein
MSTQNPEESFTPRPFRLLGEEQIAGLTPRQKMLYYALAIAEINRRAQAHRAFYGLDEEDLPT